MLKLEITLGCCCALLLNGVPILAADVRLDPSVLQDVQDRTRGIREEERDAYFQTLEHAAKADYEQQQNLARKNLAAFEKDFELKQAQAVAVFMGLTTVRPVLYMLRYSGPSNDIAEKVRTLQEVQNRGRWGAMTTVRRYEKHGQINKQLQKLTSKQLRLGLSLEGKMAALLAGRNPLPKVP